MSSVMLGSALQQECPEQGGSGGIADKVHCDLEEIVRLDRASYGLNTRSCYDKTSIQRERLNTRFYGVRRSGRRIDLDTFMSGDRFFHAPRPLRSEVRCFTRQSRNRLRKALAAIPWKVLGTRLFVTLTYGKIFPVDGRVFQRDLYAFRRRWERAFGSVNCVVWKKEFQRRGAVHWHLNMPLPDGRSVSYMRSWVARNWYEVIHRYDGPAGFGPAVPDRFSLSRGTGVEVAKSDCAGYFAYATAYKSKEYQNVVPAHVFESGRFWGIWGFRPEWVGALLDRGEFVELRRTLRKWAKSRGRYHGRKSRIASEWYLTDDGKGLALVQLVRVLGLGDRCPSFT